MLFEHERNIFRIDLGIYPLQAVMAGFGDREPERISVSGSMSGSGVDESASIQLFYGDGTMAVSTCLATCQLQNEAHFCGDKGTIKIKCPFWCPEEIEVQRYEETGQNEKKRLPLGKS